MTGHAPIVTLTMNPALDVSSTVDRVVPEHKMRCGPSRYDPGGGGVNVSRAIRNLGGHSVAIYPLGGPTGQAYRGYLEEAGIVGRVITIACSTRESFTVDETSTGEQFRFVLQGPTLREPEWRACMSVVGDHLPVGGFLVASGSLPPGVPETFYCDFGRRLAERDIRFAVDTSGPALTAALAARPALVKPNRDELAEFAGCPIDTLGDVVRAATRMRDAGAATVLASLGPDGAVLVGDGETEGTRYGESRVDRGRSTVGAGDAMLAGYLAGGVTGGDALVEALAWGAAAVQLPGSRMPGPGDVDRTSVRVHASIDLTRALSSHGMEQTQ